MIEKINQLIGDLEDCVGSTDGGKNIWINKSAATPIIQQFVDSLNSDTLLERLLNKPNAYFDCDNLHVNKNKDGIFEVWVYSDSKPLGKTYECKSYLELSQHLTNLLEKEA